MPARLIVNGGFQDLSGVILALGTLKFRLVEDIANSNVQVGAGVVTTMPLDTNGNVSGTHTLWSPATYVVKAYSATGQLVWQSTITIPSDTVPYSLTPHASVPITPIVSELLAYGTGAGNRINSANVLSPSLSLQAGDVLVLFVEASFGCTTTTSQPTFTIIDDAGNVWANAGDVYDGTGTVGNPTGGLISQISLSTWTTVHNGNPLTTITTTSTVVPDAFNFQGSGVLTQWRLPLNIGVTGIHPQVINVNTSTPTLAPFTTSGSSLVIVDLANAKAFSVSAYGSGFTAISVGHAEYATGIPQTFQPSFSVTGAATSYPHWAMVALTLGVVL